MKKVMVALAVVGAFAVGLGWSQSVSQAQEASLSTRCVDLPARNERVEAIFDELRAEGRTHFLHVPGGGTYGDVCAW